MACGKCGEKGHNASTCGNDGVVKPVKKGAAKSPAARAADALQKRVEMTVIESLRARREKCVKEIETIDRVLPELEALDLS